MMAAYLLVLWDRNSLGWLLTKEAVFYINFPGSDDVVASLRTAFGNERQTRGEIGSEKQVV